MRVTIHQVMKRRVIHIDPEILGGTPVFWGTRVPLRNLFDYLEEGESLAAFLDDFPTVSREQAVRLLEMSHQLVEQSSQLLDEDSAG